jgi:hypothetical protein
MRTLEQRLASLEAIQAIQLLKARYARLADQKYSAEYQRQPAHRMREVARLQAECFTEDAIWEGGAEFGASLNGRADLRRWFRNSPWCFALHYYCSPEIAVDGGRASAIWRLWQIALRDEDKQAVLLAAVTSEDYVLQADDGWLCSRMRFEQVQMLPMDAPGRPYPLMTAFLPHSNHIADTAGIDAKHQGQYDKSR